MYHHNLNTTAIVPPRYSISPKMLSFSIHIADRKLLSIRLWQENDRSAVQLEIQGGCARLR